MKDKVFNSILNAPPKAEGPYQNNLVSTEKYEFDAFEEDKTPVPKKSSSKIADLKPANIPPSDVNNHQNPVEDMLN